MPDWREHLLAEDNLGQVVAKDDLRKTAWACC